VAGAAVYFFYESPLQKSRSHIKKGDAGMAVELLTEALNSKIKPETEEKLRVELARAYLLKGSVDNARDQYQTVYEKFPQNPQGPLGLGRLNLLTGTFPHAVEFLVMARDRDPRNTEATLLLAWAYILQGEDALAKTEILALLNNDPTDRTVLLLLAGVNRRLGAFEESLATYDSLVQSLPGDRDARLGMARALMDSGDMAGAEKELLRLRREKENDFQSSIALAELLMKTFRWREARVLCEDLYRKDEKLYPGFLLAHCLISQGRKGEARKLLTELKKQIPPLSAFGSTSGISLPDLVDRLRATENLRYLYILSYITESDLTFEEGMPDEADKILHLALGVNSRNRDLLRALWELSTKRKNKEDSERWLARESELYPRHPEVLLDRAQYALENGNLEQARNFAREAVGFAPRLARGQVMLASIHLAGGDDVSALAHLQAACELNIFSDMAWGALGHVRLARGELEEAETALRKSLELNPSENVKFDLDTVMKQMESNKIKLSKKSVPRTGKGIIRKPTFPNSARKSPARRSQ
jgi:tetratricopeptide (TPR) repeat protein